MNIAVELFQTSPMLTMAWVVLLFLTLAAFLSSGAGKAIAAQQLTNLVNREDGVVLDIRPAAEFNKGHIVGAINIPLSKLAEADKDLERIKSRPVVVVCAQGMTAVNACKMLKQKGFEKVFRLNSGMQGWQADNLPVTKK